MILKKLFKKRAASYSPQHPRDPGLVTLFGGGASTASGITVTADTATRINAVYACISLLSETIAALPLNVFERLSAGGKQKATKHALFHKLHDQPNRGQTSFEWREMMIGHICLRGNAYSEIVASGNNPVSELIPLHPDRVKPFWAPDGSIAYEHTLTDGKTRVLLQDEMHHIKLRSNDGLKGIDPINECRESMGLASAAEQFGSRFFGSGTVFTGVLETQGKLSQDAQEKLRKQWAERYEGTQNSHKTAVLEEGLQWKSMGVQPENAQFLETRKFQVADIARIWRIPPHLIGDLERATFNNIEELGIGFVVYTLNPILVRWEQAMLRDFFTPAGKLRYFPEFNVDGLLRGNTQARTEYYRMMQGQGNMSINEVREKENLNPVQGGDTHMIPLNMMPLDQLGEQSDEDD